MKALIYLTAMMTVASQAAAQTTLKVALRSGENVELQSVYYITNCKSVAVGLPAIEILEGSENLSLHIKEETVLPVTQGCSTKIPGGKLILSAENVKERSVITFTYRLKYTTSLGDRQTSQTYTVTLLP